MGVGEQGVRVKNPDNYFLFKLAAVMLTDARDPCQCQDGASEAGRVERGLGGSGAERSGVGAKSERGS